ncbi:MAG TPA: hypothetical protein VGQ59_10905 [Cyclobacteriaceae bacterium]|jgi:hypothetical protein|nr:hypothetical protein [Cyclobacteriaceae bacterium]
MIEEFKELSKAEQKLLLQAPAIVSLFASIGNGDIDQWKKVDAIKLAHLKTFTAPLSLIPYYKEVDKTFKHDFQLYEKIYTPINDANAALLQNKIDLINNVIAKLDDKFAFALHASLISYAAHVKKAYKGLVSNFVFPFPIFGLTG